MKLFRTLVLVLSGVILILFSGLLLAGRDGRRELYRALGNLAEVVHLVHENYVDPVDLDQLERGFETGLLESVDRDAALLSGDAPAALEELPPFGIVLSRRLGSAAIREVLPGSPAETAGLGQWEILEKIDGARTRNLPLWEIRSRLRTAEASGARVTLSVLDRDVEERRTVELVPAEWKPRAFTVEEKDGALVVTVAALPRGTSLELARALKEHSGTSVVLDVRPLAWGVEADALAVADLFVTQGELGRWRGRRAGEKVFQATGTRLAGLPVVVVDRGTEGMGEVLAGALARAGATLVGEETAGHAVHLGVVREHGVRLVLPVGFWLSPDGEPLDGAGVQPDEEVKGAEEGDPPLERALELTGTRHGRKAA